jgi:hypothetical protein
LKCCSSTENIYYLSFASFKPAILNPFALPPIIAFATALTLLTSPLYSQCLCTTADEDVTISSGWPKTFPVGSGNDDIWDFEIIDANDDGIAEGYIVAGAADMGSPDGMNIHIKRLNANGIEYTGGSWPIDVTDEQNNVDAAYAVEITSTGHILVCGSKKTNKYAPAAPPYKNKNAWVMKYDFDGTAASGWPAGGIEYGGEGDDEAFDIKEDLDGKYIVVGVAELGTDDVPTNAQGDGDYWVFKLNQNGTIITNRNKVYFGDNSAEGTDYARSVAVDCNTGEYIVSGFCKSCAPEEDDHSQLFLLKVPVNFGTEDSETYGFDGIPTHNDDYGSYNVIQTQATLGSCTSGDGFFSLGLQHPPGTYGCYDGGHDFWAVKTDDSLDPDLAFDDECFNADYGQAYGGKVKDNGHSAVQICDGFLLAGITNSNNKAQTNCSTCQVACNHYDCSDAVSEDIWIAKINGTGTLIWDESLGELNKNDGAYCIKQVSENEFVVAGYTTAGTNNRDWYMVKFEITDCQERLSSESIGNDILSVYPNPSAGTIKVSLRLSDLFTQEAAIMILDQTGKVFFSSEANIEYGILDVQLSANQLSFRFLLVKSCCFGQHLSN